MSQVNAKTLMLGQNADQSKNFKITVPTPEDGTLTIERANGADVMKFLAAGGVAINGGVAAPASGMVGEIVSITGVPTNLGAAAAVWNLAAITLSPGVWDVQTYGNFIGSGTATMLDICLSTASVTMQELSRMTIGYASGNIPSRLSGKLERIITTVPTQYWCCGRVQATADVTCTGTINARRVA